MEDRFWKAPGARRTKRKYLGERRKPKAFFPFLPISHLLPTLSFSLFLSLSLHSTTRSCLPFFCFIFRHGKLIEILHQRVRESATCVSRLRCGIQLSYWTVRTHTWEIVHRKCKRVAENFGQHPLILARRGQHPVTPVRVCPCCKVAFHFHRSPLSKFDRSNSWKPD